MAVVALFDEIPEMVKRMREESMARIADKLEISPDLLEAPGQESIGYDTDERVKASLLLSSLHDMIDRFREMHRLSEDAPLVVSLGREAIEILEQRGRLLGGGAGERRYVMVGEIKVEVLGDFPGSDIIEGFVDGVREGAKRQAPTTGPRRDTFMKRGKQ
jgi:hypothetical protein